MGDLLIKGGTVIDGTGDPRFEADVLLANGKVRAIGTGLGLADKTIDAAGLVVAPGIVDPHTHLDAQLLWEPRGTSSSWHGVTTVVTGMCGYSLAPCRPEHRDYITRMFCRVEEMPLDMLRAQVPWTWETVPEYIDAFDTGLGLNVAPMVGHSSLRYYVMGPEAGQREAAADELRSMCAILRESIEAGAFGLTTSRSAGHRDWEWNPVPSRQASPEELIALAGELRYAPSTGLALISAGTLGGLTAEDKELVLGLAEASQKPVQLNAIGPSDWEFMEASAPQGAKLWAVTNSQSRYRIWTLREGTVSLHSMPTWRDIMEKPVDERLRLLAAPEMRQTLRGEVDGVAPRMSRNGQPFRIPWDAMWVGHAHKEENRSLEGVSVQELAARQGKHVADAVLDLAASEDFHTEFRNQFEPGDEIIDEAKAARVRGPHAVPMNTDAGAHLGNECRTGEPTYFLRHWVIDKPFITLEEGVRKLTGLPAEYVGLSDRGVIQEGKAADIMVFDPLEIDSRLKERAWDMPGGAKRWVQKAAGVKYVTVNGRPTIWDGEEVGDLPGRVLRSTTYR